MVRWPNNYFVIRLFYLDIYLPLQFQFDYTFAPFNRRIIEYNKGNLSVAK